MNVWFLILIFKTSPLFYSLKTKYRADYEKNKANADYNVLPATENPLLRQLKTAGNVLSDVSIVKVHLDNFQSSTINQTHNFFTRLLHWISQYFSSINLSSVTRY